MNMWGFLFVFRYTLLSISKTMDGMVGFQTVVTSLVIMV